MPLKMILRKCASGYQLGSEQHHVNHLLYLDDIKLYERNQQEIQYLVRTVKLSGSRLQDQVMDFFFFHLLFKRALCSKVKGFRPHGLLVYRLCLPPDTPIIFLVMIFLWSLDLRSVLVCQLKKARYRTGQFHAWKEFCLEVFTNTVCF